MSVYRYPWPASALTPADMAALHAVREAGPSRVPITELIARAVRQVYGEQAETGPVLRVLSPPASPPPLKEAA